MAKTQQWFEWTVKFQVHRTWVEDGFEMTADRAKSMIEEALPYADGSESRAEVIASPNADEVAKAQGYKSAEDRKESLAERG